MKQRHHYSPVIYEQRRLRPVRLARGTHCRDVCMASARHRSIRQPQLDQSPIPGPGSYVYAVFRSCAHAGALPGNRICGMCFISPGVKRSAVSLARRLVTRLPDGALASIPGHASSQESNESFAVELPLIPSPDQGAVPVLINDVAVLPLQSCCALSAHSRATSTGVRNIWLGR